MILEKSAHQVMTSVALTFDLQSPKYIQHVFKFICTSLLGMADIKKHTIFHPEMVKIMNNELKLEKVLTSVTFTFDLETPKSIQHFFGVICTSVPGLVDI